MPKKTNKRRLSHKTVLRLPDLDHAKSSVLNSLSSPRSRRNYKQRERLRRLNGGRGGIRTPDTLSGTPVFKTGAINHSATLPV